MVKFFSFTYTGFNTSISGKPIKFPKKKNNNGEFLNVLGNLPKKTGFTFFSIQLSNYLTIQFHRPKQNNFPLFEFKADFPSLISHFGIRESRAQFVKASK